MDRTWVQLDDISRAFGDGFLFAALDLNILSRRKTSRLSKCKLKTGSSARQAWIDEVVSR